MKMNPFSSRIVSLSLLGALSLHAAVLDDLVEKIEHQTSHKKHYRKHHYRHHTTLSSDAQYQTALQFLGYYHGKIDGDLSTKASFDAIIDFHTKHNEITTGFLEEEDKAYLSEVYRTLAMKKYLSYAGKNKKRKYQQIQAALRVESFYNGKIDGHFGKASKKALKRYTAQLDTNMSISEQDTKKKLINDAREKIEKEIEEIKKDTFDPNAYATAPLEEDLLTAK